MADDLGAIADELYALPAEGFVAARDDRAKQVRAAGHRDLASQVGALPKPSAAAWLVNQLARRRPDAVEQLVELGDELRHAQQSLDGDQMRALNRQRQQVVRAFARQVAQLAEELDRPLSDAVAHQVEDTLRTAVADADAGQALLSGRLTAALSYVGMGAVDVSAAVAVPGPRKAKRARTTASAGQDEVAVARERHRGAAREALADAEHAAEQAAALFERSDQRVHELVEQRDRLLGQAAAMRSDLVQVEARAAEAASEHADAEQARDDAAAVAEAAREALARARSELDDLG
ncbi:MAG: hypothetical protein H0U77_10655 [Nocardioidaceae bacterium]|nr:hypothetical protein [Nocardioidaceae bacterium]